MSRVVCRIVLAEGKWRTRPSGRGVRELLRTIFPRPAGEEAPSQPPMLARLRFDEPGEDEVLVAEVVVRPHHWHCEIIRDEIVEAFAACFRPEYESMIEVEVIE